MTREQIKTLEALYARLERMEALMEDGVKDPGYKFRNWPFTRAEEERICTDSLHACKEQIKANGGTL